VKHPTVELAQRTEDLLITPLLLICVAEHGLLCTQAVEKSLAGEGLLAHVRRQGATPGRPGCRQPRAHRLRMLVPKRGPVECVHRLTQEPGNDG
jgi:hypothetical protein